MENNLNSVEKEATGHQTMNKFQQNTYLPKSDRKKILLLSDDL